MRKFFLFSERQPASLFWQIARRVEKAAVQAAVLMVALPILLVFLASARLLVRGVLAGSVKS
tara:strand:+ start:5537 stop:5722 length:186 start_codon:yes stop_codon:yes gene_type:complete